MMMAVQNVEAVILNNIMLKGEMYFIELFITLAWS